MFYIEEGKREGATLHTGGHRVGSKGYFIEPTVFGDVSKALSARTLILQVSC